MSNGGWRRAAAVPLLIVAATNVAQGADEAPTPSGRVAVPLPPVSAAEPAASWLDVPPLLRAFGVESWWDIVHFGPWSGALALTFDDQEQRITAPAGADQRYSSRLLNESLSIRNDAFSIVDPRLLTGSMAVGISLDQEWQTATGTSTSQHGTLTNYAFDLTALPESPYNVNVFANQNQSTYVLPSGTTTRADLLSRGITFRLREDSILRDKEILPYFSGTLRAFQQYDKQTTNTEGQTFRQDDRRDIVALDLQNGTETSDLGVQYQFTNLENYAYRLGSYSSHSLNGIYSFDFGPTLNWRSDSRFNYYTRAGRDPQSDLSNLDVSEFLTIDHNAELSTNYTYQFTRQSTPVGDSTTHNASAQVQRQFYRNLSGSAGLNGSYSSLPGGSISVAGTAASLSYSHALPWQGNLYANAGGGYSISSTNVPAGLVQVTDTAYQVPQLVGAGASILLKDRNIQVLSLVVIVVKAGARVPALLDVDYTIRVDGDRTSLVPQATSAVILPGDTLNVSYNYEISPDTKYRTVTNSASVGMDWAWFGLSASHDQSDESPFSGSDATLLVSEERDLAQIYVRGLWQDWQARASAGYLRYDSSRLAYRETRLDQFVAYQASPGLQLNVAANEYRTEYDVPVHTTTGTSVRCDVLWTRGAWVTTGYASWRSYRDTQQPGETVLEAGVRLRRTWAKLDLNLAAGMQDRKRNNIGFVNAIVHVGIVRRF